MRDAQLADRLPLVLSDLPDTSEAGRLWGFLDAAAVGSDIDACHLLFAAGGMAIKLLGQLLFVAGDLARLDLADILSAELSYERQQQLNRLAPTHLAVPSGSRVALDYQCDGAPPVLALRRVPALRVLRRDLDPTEPSAWLVALAGERMDFGTLREVSAVCTHPDHAGRGHARLLVRHVMHGMQARGVTPMLHVGARNARAIGLYEALGFERNGVLRHASLSVSRPLSRRP